MWYEIGNNRPFWLLHSWEPKQYEKARKAIGQLYPGPNSRIFLVSLQNILLKLVSFVSEMQYVTMTKSKFIMP